MIAAVSYHEERNILQFNENVIYQVLQNQSVTSIYIYRYHKKSTATPYVGNGLQEGSHNIDPAFCYGFFNTSYQIFDKVTVDAFHNQGASSNSISYGWLDKQGNVGYK